MSIKYICLKCGKTKGTLIGAKTGNRLVKGKPVQVPICCGWKMAIKEN